MILKVIYLLCSFTFICSVHSKSDVVTEETCEGIIFEHWIIVYLFSATSVNIYYILVCVKLVRRFSDTLEGDEKNDASLIEVRFKQFCKSLKGKDERFVWPFNFLIYYIYALFFHSWCSLSFNSAIMSVGLILLPRISSTNWQNLSVGECLLRRCARSYERRIHKFAT